MSLKEKSKTNAILWFTCLISNQLFILEIVFNITSESAWIWLSGQWKKMEVDVFLISVRYDAIFLFSTFKKPI